MIPPALIYVSMRAGGPSPRRAHSAEADVRLPGTAESGGGFGPAGREKRRRIILPLVLLWPILLPLFLVAALAAFVLGVVMLPFGPRRAVRTALFLPRVYRLACALRGLRVDVTDPGPGGDPGGEVSVRIW